MKVLIVDDEKLIRSSLSRALSSRGHDVVEAVDGSSAFDIWVGQDFDLVLLDVLMPGLSGPQLLAKIGKKANTFVILMSAYTGEMNFGTARQMGADAFLPKPFENIFKTVDEIEQLFKNK